MRTTPSPKQTITTASQSKEVSRLLAEITCLEEELNQVATRLDIPGLDTLDVARLQEDYNDITLALDALLSDWEQLSQT